MAMEEMSAIHPMKIGNMAPPTMDMTRNDEALLVCSPISFIPSEKMVGNMMDIKKKERNSAMIETQPKRRLTTGNRSTLIRE